MWASGRLEFHGELRVGEPHPAELRDPQGRREGGQGRADGVRHRPARGGLAARAGHRRGAGHRLRGRCPRCSCRPPPVAAPADPAWSEPVAVDPVLLFRFSALTFNGHRIHYDLPYATGVEKYPGPGRARPAAGAAADAVGRSATIRAAARRGSAFAGVRPLFHFEAPAAAGPAARRRRARPVHRQRRRACRHAGDHPLERRVSRAPGALGPAGPGLELGDDHKTAGSAADAVCIDLEDAVAPREKEASRANVARAFTELDFGAQAQAVPDERARHRLGLSATWSRSSRRPGTRSISSWCPR